MLRGSDKADTIARLEALSSPVRRDLYDVLLVHGDLSASDLRRLVPEAKPSLAHEMGRLVDAGLAQVVQQSGRHKTWRGVLVTISWVDSDREDPDLSRALTNFERAATVRRAQRMDAWFREKTAGRWEARLLDAAVSTDYLLSLTPDELTALDEAVYEAITAIRGRSDARRAAGDTSDESAVFVCAMAFPFDPART